MIRLLHGLVFFFKANLSSSHPVLRCAAADHLARLVVHEHDPEGDADRHDPPEPLLVVPLGLGLTGAVRVLDAEGPAL